MHICFVSRTPVADEPYWGGVHTHTEMLAILLRKLGIEVSLITPKHADGAAAKRMDNIRVVSCSEIAGGVMNRVWMKEVHDAFMEIHSEKPVDCLFSQDYWAYGLHRELTTLNIPIVTFIHNFSLVHFYNNATQVKGIRSLAGYLFKNIPTLVFRIFKYELPFYNSSRYVVSVSALNARYLRNVYRLPHDKIRVIHNWIKTDLFAPNDLRRKQLRAQLNIPENTLVFLLVGSLWRPKGFHIAIRSFGQFVRSFDQAMLLVVGATADNEYLQKLRIENEDVRRKIVFFGRQEHDKLPPFHNAADVFIMPSLMAEGCPYALLEAMSSGLPIIATRIGGNPEVLGNAGILVRTGSSAALTKAMVSLAQTPEERELLSRSARQWVLENFSEKTAIRKISGLIESL